MSFLGYLTLAASVIWWGSEVAIAIIKHSKPWSIRQDKFSYWVVWLAFLVSILAALGISKSSSVGRFLHFEPFLGYTGCLIIVAGVSIRWIAVVTLGRHFTLQVAIIKDHRLIDYGVYRLVRHPSYLGSLVSFVGFGLVMENWISLIVVFILPFAAIAYRIAVEEKVLLGHFGTQYEQYCRRTKRLLPGLY